VDTGCRRGGQRRFRQEIDIKTRVHRARSFLRALFALATTKVVLTGGGRENAGDGTIQLAQYPGRGIWSAEIGAGQALSPKGQSRQLNQVDLKGDGV
jgi:hypothetical protein